LLRVLPFIFGIVVSVGLALPAFLLLEPLATGEPMSAQLLLLATLGIAGVGTIAVRLCVSVVATQKQASAWMKNSQRVLLPNLPTMFVVPEPLALIAVVGIFRPRLFISADVLSSLQPEELAAAVQHELAHLGCFDNLKHLAMRLTRPPKWIRKSLSIDDNWLHASEIAADDAALRHGTSALDLASALVKVAKMNSRAVLSPAVNASHLIPDGATAQLPARIMNLQHCVERYPHQSPTGGLQSLHARSADRVLIPALALAAYVVTLVFGLPLVHELIEALVR
jgi:Zn-dependent protease with chaperone function